MHTHITAMAGVPCPRPVRHRRPYGGLPARLRAGSAIGVALAAMAMPAGAGPTGGQVVAGQASITATAPGVTTIQQDSNSAIIHWDRFDLAAGERAQFHQPGANAVVLNRVVGNDLSHIAGHVTANGKLFLINPHGVVFAAGSSVDVNTLVVSTADIANRDFLEGRYRFDRASPVDGARISNAGTITVAEAGLAALMAPAVENSGVIAARLGTVALATGRRFAVDFQGDGLVSFEVAEGAAGGSIEAGGLISADGGTVLMTAAQAGGILDSIIRVTGGVEANSVDVRDGSIILYAGDGGRAELHGRLAATGTRDGEQGGQVRIDGGMVGLMAEARIDVSGRAGGGQVRIGGEVRGGDGTTPAAKRTYVDPGATIRADAMARGDGGDIVVWSEEVTRFGGTISARGAAGGDGGFVEVSGREHLVFQGRVDVGTQAGGRAGTILLDPRDLIIADAGPDNGLVLDATLAFSAIDEDTNATLTASLVSNLTGNVVLQASRNLTIDATLDFADPATSSVTFQAGDSININATVESSGAALNFHAAHDPQWAGYNAEGRIQVAAALGSDSTGDILLTAGTGGIGGGIGLGADITTGGLATLSSRVTLEADVIITSTATSIDPATPAPGGISLAAVTGGGHALTLDHGAGALTLNGVSGASALMLDGTGTRLLNTGTYATTAEPPLDLGAVTLDGIITLGQATRFGDSLIAGPVIIQAGTHDVTFTGTVMADAASTDPVRSLTVNSLGATLFEADVGVGENAALAFLETDRGRTGTQNNGTLELRGNVVTTDGQIYRDRRVRLAGSLYETTGATGGISFQAVLAGSGVDLAGNAMLRAAAGIQLSTGIQAAAVPAPGTAPVLTIARGAGPLVLSGVAGVAALNLTGTGTVTLQTGTYALAGGTPLIFGNVTLAGVLTLGQDTSFADSILGASTRIEAGSRNVTFTGRVDSDGVQNLRTLTVNSLGTTIFRGDVGGRAALGAIETDSGRDPALDNGALQLLGSVFTTGTQLYRDRSVLLAGGQYATHAGGSNGNLFAILGTGGQTILGADTLVTTGSGGAIFAQTVNSAAGAPLRRLTVNSRGLTRFDADIGRRVALAALETDSGGMPDGDHGTLVLGGSVITAGNQTYRDRSVTLSGGLYDTGNGGDGGGDFTLSSIAPDAGILVTGTTAIRTGGGTAGFATAITGAPGATLAIDTGSGALVLNGSTGLDRLALTGTGTRFLHAGLYSTSGDDILETGDVTVNGRLVFGRETRLGAVTLADGTALEAGGNLETGGIAGNGFNLDLTGAGDITLAGAAGIGTLSIDKVDGGVRLAGPLEAGLLRSDGRLALVLAGGGSVGDLALSHTGSLAVTDGFAFAGTADLTQPDRSLTLGGTITAGGELTLGDALLSGDTTLNSSGSRMGLVQGAGHDLGLTGSGTDRAGALEGIGTLILDKADGSVTLVGPAALDGLVTAGTFALVIGGGGTVGSVTLGHAGSLAITDGFTFTQGGVLAGAGRSLALGGTIGAGAAQTLTLGDAVLLRDTALVSDGAAIDAGSITGGGHELAITGNGMVTTSALAGISTLVLDKRDGSVLTAGRVETDLLRTAGDFDLTLAAGGQVGSAVLGHGGRLAITAGLGLGSDTDLSWAGRQLTLAGRIDAASHRLDIGDAGLSGGTEVTSGGTQAGTITGNGHDLSLSGTGADSIGNLETVATLSLDKAGGSAIFTGAVQAGTVASTGRFALSLAGGGSGRVALAHRGALSITSGFTFAGNTDLRMEGRDLSLAGLVRADGGSLTLGAASLTGNTELYAVNITATGPLSGGQAALTAMAAEDLTLQGSLTSGSLTATAGRITLADAATTGMMRLTGSAAQGPGITLNGRYTASGLITTGATVLAGDSVVRTGNGGTDFNGTLTGTHALFLESSGTTRLGGDIGLSRLDVAGTAIIAAALVETTGTQDYRGDVRLARDTALRGSHIRFAGPILSAMAANGGQGTGPAALSVTGSVTVTFGGDIGQAGSGDAASQALRSLTVAAPDIVLGQSPDAGIIVRTAGNAAGADAGDQTFTGQVRLLARTVRLDTTNAGASTGGNTTLAHGGDLSFSHMSGADTAVTWWIGTGSVQGVPGSTRPDINLGGLTISGFGGRMDMTGIINGISDPVAAQIVRKDIPRSNDMRLNGCAVGSPTCIVIPIPALSVPQQTYSINFQQPVSLDSQLPLTLGRGNEDLW
ncbi:filamentous hemagglutinin N-terminal domain-containing protein [Niveispirillum fermenti]|uniref:two-partner secretion domain-containing protein n=1 Tax=Niveispirillum fermenti TaxID=1233113 RepID=UPI003A8C4E43